MKDQINDIKKQLFRIDQEFKERLDMIEEGIDDMLIEKQRNDLSFDFSSMSEEDIAEFRQISSDLLIFFLSRQVGTNRIMFFLSWHLQIAGDQDSINKDTMKQWQKLLDRINTLKNKY